MPTQTYKIYLCEEEFQIIDQALYFYMEAAKAYETGNDFDNDYFIGHHADNIELLYRLIDAYVCLNFGFSREV